MGICQERTCLQRAAVILVPRILDAGDRGESDLDDMADGISTALVRCHEAFRRIGTSAITAKARGFESP